jgi:hypothetical protein
LITVFRCLWWRLGLGESSAVDSVDDRAGMRELYALPGSGIFGV